MTLSISGNGDILTLSSATTAAAVYTPAGTGAVPTTIANKLQQSVSVFDFMTPTQIADVKARTLSQNVKTCITAAFAASKRVKFEPGAYWLGEVNTSSTFFDLTSLGTDITIESSLDVELLCTTTVAAIPVFFSFSNNSHLNFGAMRFRDLGYDPLITWKGAEAIRLTGGVDFGDIEIGAIYGKSLVSCLTVTGQSTARIRGIHVGQIFSDDCYYGVNCANQGDGLTVDSLIAYQNYRPYFVYGVTGHKVNVFNRNARAGSGQINISRSVSGYDTTGIDVRYVCRDTTLGITHVLINHIDLLGGKISGINLDIDAQSSALHSPIRFVNYTGSGGSETSSASLNTITDINIKGSADVNANECSALCSLTGVNVINFQESLYLRAASNMWDRFYFNRTTTPPTVEWTGSVTNPTIGNGSIIARSDVINGVAFINVTLTIGSTTVTAGTGNWGFRFPAYIAKTSNIIGTGFIFDAGTGYWTAAARMIATDNIVYLYTNNTGVNVGGSAPITWAAGDKLEFSIAIPLCV